ncbi:hypothetical protein [Methylomonas fluvii]|nr:hypothetical protein [Methylomonas fluvii]
MTISFFANRHFVSSFLTTAANAIQQLIFSSTLLIQPLNTVSLHAFGTEGPISSGCGALSPDGAHGINKAGFIA